MLEIVADVRDDEEIIRLNDPAQAQGELGAPNAAR
jgi:hypothetical protein